MSGIYLICNVLTGDVYVGSTTETIQRRWSQHLYRLKNNKHHSQFLQNSWNKYGYSAFLWVILEHCNNVLEREQFYINEYLANFNMTKIAGNTKGVIFTEERKRKISEALKGHTPWNKGSRKWSDDQRREKAKLKMRERRIDNPRMTKQERILNSRSKSIHKKQVLRSDGLITESVREMSRIMNIGHSSIVRAIKRKIKARGYTFKYLNTKEDHDYQQQDNEHHEGPSQR